MRQLPVYDGGVRNAQNSKDGKTKDEDVYAIQYRLCDDTSHVAREIQLHLRQPSHQCGDIEQRVDDCRVIERSSGCGRHTVEVGVVAARRKVMSEADDEAVKIRRSIAMRSQLANRKPRHTRGEKEGSVGRMRDEEKGDRTAHRPQDGVRASLINGGPG